MGSATQNCWSWLAQESKRWWERQWAAFLNGSVSVPMSNSCLVFPQLRTVIRTYKQNTSLLSKSFLVMVFITTVESKLGQSSRIVLLTGAKTTRAGKSQQLPLLHSLALAELRVIITCHHTHIHLHVAFARKWMTAFLLFSRCPFHL